MWHLWRWNFNKCGRENSVLKLDGKHAGNTFFCRRLGRYAEIRRNVRIIWTNKMHYFVLIYFNNKPLHISSRLAAHHQPVNTTHYYTSFCLYRGVPPDDEQQACSKHVEAFYWNKLIEKNASCCFILYGYITMQGKQNSKSEEMFKEIPFFFNVLRTNLTRILLQQRLRPWVGRKETSPSYCKLNFWRNM